MHYVIGDVHGCYDELMALLHKIEERDKEAQFLLVGDLIDRGPKVWEVLQWALQNITPAGKFQCVRGNHEQLALEWWAEYEKWYRTGRIWPTPPFSEYDIAGVLYENVKPTGKEGYHTPEDFQEIVDFWEGLPYSKRVLVETLGGRQAAYRIVHAWYDYSLEEEHWKQYNINLYCRRLDGNHEKPEEIIVFGHTPTLSERFIKTGQGTDRPGMIGYREYAINVDCGCVFADRREQFPCMLGAICLETLEEIYSCTLEERMEALRLQKYEETYFHKENWVNPFKLRMLRKLGLPAWYGREGNKL